MFSRIGNVIESHTNDSFFMPFKSFDQFTFLHSPQFEGSISTTRNKICWIAGEPTIPYPLQVAFKLFVFSHLKFLRVVDFE